MKENKKIKLKELKNKNFSLVLSGGSALGFAHLGIIDFLNENNLKPNEIIGTSMGAIIGAAYACGKSEEEINNILIKSGIFFWIKVSFKKFSLLSTKKVEKTLFKLFGDRKFSDLNMKLKIIGTDLNSGNSHIFDKINNPNLRIIDAVLASMTLPIVFPLKKINNTLFVDGYLSSNYPIEFSSNKIILGVDVFAKKDLNDFKVNNSIFFSKFKTLFNIYDRSFYHLIRIQTKLKIKTLDLKYNLISIEPDLNKYKTTDYSKFEEIKEWGYFQILKYFKT